MIGFTFCLCRLTIVANLSIILQRNANIYRLGGIVNKGGSSKQLSRYDEAISKIRDAISQGDLRPNQRVVERDVAKKLNMSRTPVREALRTLELRGYLMRRSSSGYVVMDHTIEQIRKWYETQEAIETMAIRLACQHIGRKTVKRAEEYNDKINDAVAKGNIEDCIEFNVAFHDELYRDCENEQLLSFYNTLKDKPFVARWLRLCTKAELVRWAHDHGKMLEAVKTGKARAAETAVRRHCRRVFRIVSKKLGGY